MVLRADVLAAALDSVADGRPMLAMTPRGAPLTQARVRELAAGPGAILLCGRFEGFDERIFEARDRRAGVDRRLCAVGRRARRDGPARCLRSAASRRNGRGLQRRGGELRRRGFSNIRIIPDLLTWEGRTIPEVLRSGDHAKIAAWRNATRDRRHTAKAAGPDRAPRGRSQAPPSGARRRRRRRVRQ